MLLVLAQVSLLVLAQVSLLVLAQVLLLVLAHVLALVRRQLQQIRAIEAACHILVLHRLRGALLVTRHAGQRTQILPLTRSMEREADRPLT